MTHNVSGIKYFFIATLLPFIVEIGLVKKSSAEFKEGEAMIHPAGFPTADVLKKSEAIFAPHGWASYGLTSQVTGTVDWLTTSFGVPAFSLRYQPPHQESAKYAAEFYALYARRTIESDRYEQKFNMKLQGTMGYIHFLRSAPLTSKTRLHVYIGANYMQRLDYVPRKSTFPENIHENFWNPDAGVAIEQFVNRALKLNLNAYYGNSFYYYDQDPQKYMLTYGIYWTPFSTRHHPFWSNIRLEINGYYVYIPDARYHFFTIPFFPILTWQWGG